MKLLNALEPDMVLYPSVFIPIAFLKNQTNSIYKHIRFSFTYILISILITIVPQPTSPDTNREDYLKKQ